MIESRSGLPCGRGVTARAIVAQLAVVLIRVAARALARKTEIRAVQVFDPDVGPCRDRNICRFMAIVTARGSVSAGKRKAGLAVIQGCTGRLPPNQIETSAVMF